VWQNSTPDSALGWVLDLALDWALNLEQPVEAHLASPQGPEQQREHSMYVAEKRLMRVAEPLPAKVLRAA